MKKHYYVLTLLSLMLCASLSFAQTNVSGTVIEASSGEGLPGVNVVVKGTATGTLTDQDGNFSLSVEQGKYLVFSFVGFRSQEVEVGAATSINITMEDDFTSLEEVVISGLATSVKRSNLANAVSTVTGEELTGKTGIQTLDGGLQGKIVGANILANSGAPGGGISMKLRGITTVTGSSEPLYIIDGVYIDNKAISNGTNTISAASTSGAITTNQDNSANRIADLDPSDIANIEILKGASASAIYGSRANAGVVIITTKRGSEGKTKINFKQDFGITKILNPLGVRQFTSQLVLDDFGPAAQADFDAANAAGKIFDYEDEIYGETGFLRTSKISASGGDEDTKFFISASAKDEEGIIKKTGFERYSVRANVDHRISDKVDFNISSNYIKSHTERGITNNDNAGVSYGVALAFTLPWVDLFPDDKGVYPDHPGNPSNPLATRDKSQIGDETNRFIIGSGLNFNLIKRENSFLQLRLQGGLDYYNNESTLHFPEDLQFTIGNQNGLYSRGNNVTFNTNSSVFLIYNTTVGAVDMTTSVGFNKINQKTELLTAQAQNLIVGQTNLEQAGSVAVFNRVVESEDIGYAFQQEANWDDKLIATASLRLDKSSLNGDVNKIYSYPKFSLAANIANFDFWSFDFINQLKARVAYGEAGGVPNPNAVTFVQPKFTALAPLNTGGNGGAVGGASFGDPEIQPERSKELELGLDLSLMESKVGFSFTWYNKKVEDLILVASLPPTSGFINKQSNLGALENKGIEMSLNAQVVNTSAIKLNTLVNWWKNDSELTRLDVAAFNPPGGGFGAGLGTIRLEEGKSLTQIVGNGNSGSVEQLGDAAPDFQMSWNTDLTFLKNFTFGMLWHYKAGGQNVNLSGFLSDLGGTSYNYDEIQSDGQRLGDARQAVSSAVLFVEDSDYIKLRELSLFYSFPKALLQSAFKGGIDRIKIGFSGNNLFLKSDYTSYDPEVSNFGSGGVLQGIEVTPFPSAKRMFFHIDIGF